MKTLAVVLLATLLLTSGCFVMTQTTTTARQIGTRQGDALPGKLEQVTLDASARDSTVVVQATGATTCARDVLNVYEVREARHLRSGGADDPRARVFGMFLAPLTLPVSALVSAYAVLNTPDHTTERTNVDHTDHFACTTKPAVAVSIDLPSGSHVRATTDAHGRLAYTIPPIEPDDGEVTVSAELARSPRTVTYHRPAPVEHTEVIRDVDAPHELGVQSQLDHGATSEHDDATITKAAPIDLSPTTWYLRGGFASIAGSPGVGAAAGIRHRWGTLALDVSGMVGAGGPMTTGATKGELLYLTAPGPQSWYLGGGLSFGDTATSMTTATGATITSSASGFQGELTAGYQFVSSVIGRPAFVQADLTLPTYEAPGTSQPTLMISFGVVGSI